MKSGAPALQELRRQAGKQRITQDDRHKGPNPGGMGRLGGLPGGGDLSAAHINGKCIPKATENESYEMAHGAGTEFSDSHSDRRGRYEL